MGAAQQEVRMNAKPAVTLDLSGLTCPAPLLGAKRVLDDLDAGQVLLLVSDCPGTFDAISAWVKLTDHELVATEKGEGRRTHYYLRKGRLAPPTANVTLDIRGVSCPGPILEAKKLLDGMRPGEVLHLISSCPGTPDDVRAWTRSTGLELVATRETARNEYEFFVRKK